MSKPIAYGIDFGTTNSSISIAYPGYAEMVPLTSSDATMLPSIVYLDATGNRLVGDDAVRAFLITGGRGGRLISSIKSYLTDESFTSTRGPTGRTYRMENLVSIILAHLKRAADRHCGVEVTRAVIGHPVVFAGALGARFQAQQDLALDRLGRAARQAGFKEVVFVDEATAALQGEDVESGVLMSVDFGGGTFDVSIMDVSPKGWPVLATHGAVIGGERFDSLVFDAKVGPALGLGREYVRNGKRRPVPGALTAMRTLPGLLRMASDDQVALILERWRAVLPLVDEIINGGHSYEFFRSIEEAKIRLSSVPEDRVSFRRPGITIDERFTRAEFNKIIKGDLDLLDDTIELALSEAGIAPGDVDSVVRTGGSSQIPAFVERLTRRFGTAKVVERDAFSTVGLGLGLKAIEVWGTR